MSGLPSKCVVGHCTKCGQRVWAFAKAARADSKSGISAGQEFPLWPHPTSLYARLDTGSGEAPGIPFCLTCAPKVGEPALANFGPVIRYETAHGRYARWFTEDHGRFRRAWLRDALSLEPPQVDALMAQWAKDRRG